MTATICDTNSQRLAQHSFESWEQCVEWIDSYITFNGLTRTAGYNTGSGNMTVWVEERK